MVWYSHLFQNFPQFIVIHTVKGFGVVNKAEIDVFLELSCFFHDLADIGNLIFRKLYIIKSLLWDQIIMVFLPHIVINHFIQETLSYYCLPLDVLKSEDKRGKNRKIFSK